MLRRLRGRSLAELRERGAQIGAAWAERAGLRDAGEPDARARARLLAPGVDADPAALLARFRARPRPLFFPGPWDAAATAAAVERRAPEHRAAVVARAERVLAGRFDLLGHRDLSFGHPVDWQRDPLAGRRAPLVHWSRVPYLDPAVVGDHKVVWELNRHQFLVTLAQAHAYTGDERFAAGAVRYVTEWMDANPPKLGINWASSLEVAFRAMSWLWMLHLLRSSPALTPELYARMLGVLAIHGRHLERYLSTYFSPNTHLTGEALGLVHLGLLLPELAAAPRWLARGQAVLETWLPRHARPDGVYFEQASQYHRYTTEFYAHLVILAEANGRALAPHVRPTLERLFDHLLHLARPDGTIPLFGDDDGGRLAQLDDRTPDDVRATLAVGAVLFARDDLAFAARRDVAAMGWLLGAEGLRRFDRLAPRPPAATSRAFPEGGFYVMRDGWDAEADWLAVDCGPHGAMNCGHAHADVLSVEVAAGGRPVFVDGGTYSYPGPERNRFRHAAAHNTLTLDGESSSAPGTPFQWATVATATAERWLAGERLDYFAGRHDGYRRLADPAVHRREILHVRGEYWVLRDRVEARGTHEAVVRFHGAPGLAVTLGHEGAPSAESPVVEVRDGAEGDVLLRLAVFGRGGTLSVEDGWVSPIYGAKCASRVCTFRERATGGHDIVTVLAPVAAGRGLLSAAELEDVTGGRGIRVVTGRGDDLLLAGDGAALAHGGVETDARWCWLRRDPAGDVVAYAAVDAGYLRVDGRELFGGERRALRAGGVEDAAAAAHQGSEE